jgi:hypothetical protein
MLSPVGFVATALLIALVFAIVHVLGWREHTTFLSGTPVSAGAGADQSEVLGTAYIAAYLAFVLLCPILLLAAGLLWLGERLLRASRRRSSPPADL